MHIGLRSGDLKERGHFEDLNVERRITLKWLFQKWGGKAWTALIGLGIGTGGGRL